MAHVAPNSCSAQSSHPKRLILGVFETNKQTFMVSKGSDTRRAKHGAKHGTKHGAKHEAKHETLAYTNAKHRAKRETKHKTNPETFCETLRYNLL